ncbi:MAG TPA: thiamine biosynthesis protein ThiS [Ignisphaera sp.]|uniref:Thiamine biosynthesis protein ThiS n=1 Tax=Ignisphaera aggregans TaxID=334771 RepID=A0A833DTU7_9CREN|nr:thiamine biosynthesis protein ThiS [Ignisphaera sp.]HIP57290.1 thiamine biosynthesis protein ThiS [Ignisphaera aggregans]
MVIKVRIVPENKEVEVRGGNRRVRELLKELGLSLEEAVVVKNGRVVLDDEVVKDGESVEVLLAVSGG